MTNWIENMRQKNNREKKRYAWIIAAVATGLILIFFVTVQYPNQLKNSAEESSPELDELRDSLAEADNQFKQNAEELKKFQDQLDEQNRDILRDEKFIAEQIASLNGRVLSLGRIQDGVKLSVDGLIPNEEQQQVQLIFVLENQGTEHSLRFPALTKSDLYVSDSEIQPSGYSGKTEEYVNSPLAPGDIYSGSLIFPWFDVAQAGRFTALIEIGEDQQSEFSFEWPVAPAEQ